MYKIVILIFVAAMVQDLEACCCVSREPYMTQTCLESLFGLSPSYCPPKRGCGCFKDKKPLERFCKPKCNPPTVLYYPEVEYPTTCYNYNTNPFYYNTCFGY